LTESTGGNNADQPHLGESGVKELEMQVSIKQIVNIAFRGERLIIAMQAMSYGLGDQYESADITIDDVRRASSKIEEKLNQLYGDVQKPDFFTGKPESQDEQMRQVTVISETAEQIRSIFEELSR
jgi:hypothetical protein